MILLFRRTHTIQVFRKTNGYLSSRQIPISRINKSSAQLSMRRIWLLRKRPSLKRRAPAHVLHQAVELRGIERLRAVAQRVRGIVVHLDHQAVRAGGDGRARERLHHPGDARRVRGIDDHRQMRLLLDDGHGRDIEVVADHLFKRADAALAEDHVGVAAG